jgi:hypothetical protein
MGYSKFIAVRQSLIDKGYIRIVEKGTPNSPGVKGLATVIECCDLWLRNFMRYAAQSDLAQKIAEILYFGDPDEACSAYKIDDCQQFLDLENGTSPADRGLKSSAQRGIALQSEVPKDLILLNTKDKKSTAAPSSRGKGSEAAVKCSSFK